jgi:3,4-dihydroxy 2-butanone 4-phosphate synthase/GTP cyclohydrolase II
MAVNDAVRDDRRGDRGHPRRALVVVVDDEDRENEGDLVIAAQFATPESRELSWPRTGAD